MLSKKMQPIYIADDSADQRYLFGYFLKRVNPNYSLMAFDRAQPLLDTLLLALQTGGVLPLAVFVDLQMPEIGGFEVLEIIMQFNANSPVSSPVPVIIYSGYSDQATIERCLQAGAFAFLKKPVDLNDLTNLLLTIQP